MDSWDIEDQARVLRICVKIFESGKNGVNLVTSLSIIHVGLLGKLAPLYAHILVTLRSCGRGLRWHNYRFGTISFFNGQGHQGVCPWWRAHEAIENPLWKISRDNLGNAEDTLNSLKATEAWSLLPPRAANCHWFCRTVLKNNDNIIILFGLNTMSQSASNIITLITGPFHSSTFCILPYWPLSRCHHLGHVPCFNNSIEC